MNFQTKLQFIAGVTFDSLKGELNYLNRYRVKLNRETFDFDAIKNACSGVFISFDITNEIQKVFITQIALRQLIHFEISSDSGFRILLKDFESIPVEKPYDWGLEVNVDCRTVIRFSGDGVALTAPRALGTLILTDDLEVAAFFSLKKTIPKREFLSPRTEALVLQLYSAGFLSSPLSEVEEDTLAYWDSMDLAFHNNSQRRAPLRSGSTFRTTEHLPALPDVVQAGPVSGTHEWIAETTVNDFQMIRKTTRSFGDPLRLEKNTVSNFLKKALSPVQREAEHWPYPAPGGIYNFNFYLQVNSLKTVEPGIYRFDDKECSLTLQKSDEKLRQQVLERSDSSVLSGSPPSLILIITADFSKISKVYEKIAYRLQLITAGCILQNLYSCGEPFGIGIRPIGSTDDRLITKLLKLEQFREIFVLQVELGALPPGEQ